MKIVVEVAEYRQEYGISDTWVGDHDLAVKINNGEVLIFGNNAGLMSLASNLLALAQESVPSGYHMHFSQDYGLMEDSADLIIGKN